MDELFSDSSSRTPRPYLPTILKSQATYGRSLVSSYRPSSQSQRTLVDFGGLKIQKNKGFICVFLDCRIWGIRAI